jgi:hypothetical protein
MLPMVYITTMLTLRIVCSLLLLLTDTLSLMSLAIGSRIKVATTIEIP